MFFMDGTPSKLLRCFLRKYAVVGHPIAHSRSPEIHAAFAEAHGVDLSYERILAPLGELTSCLNELRARKFCGVNVTVPFKLDAFAYATQLSTAARWAGAVNTLRFDSNQVLGDNTDGAGLVRDVEVNLYMPLKGKRILLLGAGGAARGVLCPILLAQPLSITVKNRSLDKAQAWLAQIQKADDFKKVVGDCVLSVADWQDDTIQNYDVVINATASGLADDFVVPAGVVFVDGALAYDMMYGKQTAFLTWAGQLGVRTADGWGMLVEQAAASFYIWHGVMPETQRVLESR